MNKEKICQSLLWLNVFFLCMLGLSYLYHGYAFYHLCQYALSKTPPSPETAAMNCWDAADLSVRYAVGAFVIAMVAVRFQRSLLLPLWVGIFLFGFAYINIIQRVADWKGVFTGELIASSAAQVILTMVIGVLGTIHFFLLRSLKK